AAEAHGHLGGTGPLDEHQLLRHGAAQAPVRSDALDPRADVRQPVLVLTVPGPVDDDLHVEPPLRAGDRLLGGFATVREHPYASKSVSEQLVRGNRGELVSSEEMWTVLAPPPMSHSVAVSPASSWGAAKCSGCVVSPEGDPKPSAGTTAAVPAGTVTVSVKRCHSGVAVRSCHSETPTWSRSRSK